MSDVTVINYGMGNIASVVNMLRKLGYKSEVATQPEELINAKKIILPGVGAFDHGMQQLRQSGLFEMLEQKVQKEKTLILGICLGMQLFARRSEEGMASGFGWIKADVKRFQVAQSFGLKVPHMGWNYAKFKEENVFKLKTDEEQRFYFVHSFYVDCDDEKNVLATTSYGIEFCSALIQENIIGVQFHPEKSHRFGMALLKGFMEL